MLSAPVHNMVLRHRPSALYLTTDSEYRIQCEAYGEKAKFNSRKN
jgi:hypothetical protein